jgi:tRNA 2-thiouridine synthesizing protein E
MGTQTQLQVAIDPATARIEARLEAIERKLDALAQKGEATEELFSEMTPIAREMLGTATAKLDAMEKKGYFAFGRELLGVTERVVEGFSPEDVRALADAAVSILGTVRTLTQPRVLEIANEASEVLERADEAAPIGILGMVRASRDEDVQKGMAVMMDVLRKVGRVAKAVADDGAKQRDRRDKLAAVLGPKKKRVLGVERPAPHAIAKEATAPPVRSKPEAGPTMLDGVAFGADGHLVDAASWTEALATSIAAAQAVDLDEARWAIVRFARAEFLSVGGSPNIRRITQGAHVATKDLYALFPKAPARTIAKIAGIPKPVGCI